jgi:hypothetical protein
MFKAMATVLTNIKAQENEMKKISPFIFRKWLGNHTGTIQAANFLNIYNNIPFELQYDFIQQSIKGRISYIPYIGKKKQDNSQVAQIEKVAKHYNISYKKAEEYLEFLTKEDIKEINRIFDIKENK